MIRISEQEARALGLAAPPRAATTTATGQMNGLERDFDERLAWALCVNRIRHCSFEAIKLKLAGGCWYTPDFFVLDAAGRMWFVEVKGFWRDDAKVKVKVAAALHPHFGWLVAKRSRGVWRAYAVGPGGIARRPLDGFPWDTFMQGGA